MLCDELKVYVPQDGPYGLEPEEGGKLVEEETCYLKSEVDAAIAELKKKLMPCLNGDCILTCEVVEKYGKENAELKAEIESIKASHYAEMEDAGMRERRLRRALWLARAEKAKTIAKIYSQEAELTLLREHYPSGCGFCHIMNNKWRKVEQLCRAKAEQYK